MKIRPETDRRSFLALARATAAAALFPCRAVRARQALNVRIISNYGAENDSLEQVMRDKRFLQKRGVEAEQVKVRGPRSNLEGLVKGDADVCALSAYNPLPDIEAGAPVKLIGAAMKLAALAVFSRDPQIGRVNDLRGRSIGIGPKKRLLHVAMVALCARRASTPTA